jgi:hypothetical protein
MRGKATNERSVCLKHANTSRYQTATKPLPNRYIQYNVSTARSVSFLYHGPP